MFLEFQVMEKYRNTIEVYAAALPNNMPTSRSFTLLDHYKVPQQAYR